jgi:hypothetical protein
MKFFSLYSSNLPKIDLQKLEAILSPSSQNQGWKSLLWQLGSFFFVTRLTTKPPPRPSYRRCRETSLLTNKELPVDILTVMASCYTRPKNRRACPFLTKRITSGTANVNKILNLIHKKNRFGLFPSSGILGTRKYDISETGSVSVLRCGGTDTYSVGSLKQS